jgi:hypothetical protein
MNHTTDVWWSSTPSSPELSRRAAHRSATAQALTATRRPGRVSARRWLDAAKAALSGARVQQPTLKGRASADPRPECGS